MSIKYLFYKCFTIIPFYLLFILFIIHLGNIKNAY